MSARVIIEVRHGDYNVSRIERRVSGYPDWKDPEPDQLALGVRAAADEMGTLLTAPEAVSR